MKLEKITDPELHEHVGPVKGGMFANGEKATYTCEHVLTEAGIWKNVATVEGNHKPETSNEVEVKVRSGSLTVNKEQASRDLGAYTTAKLTGKVGETVDYLITVTDTGTLPVKLKRSGPELHEHLGPVEGGTIASGEKRPTPANTCSRSREWKNVATVESRANRTVELGRSRSNRRHPNRP